MNNNLFDMYKKKYEEKRDALDLKAYQLIEIDVEVVDPKRLDIRGNLTCGSNVKIDINVIFEGNVILENSVIVGANCILKNCKIGKNTILHPYSLVDDAVIGESCFIGPYGRIRPGSCLGDSVQIGNFVEIKNAQIGSKCRINHHAFVGDADLAEQVTIGAGVITCNHDGVGINRTIIEQGAYVGSGCNLVAPVKINTNATIASGSTITEEAAANTLTIARSRQVKIENWKGPKLRK